MNRTTIEWCDFTVNPLRATVAGYVGAKGEGVGHYCEKVSAGCANCYASRLQPRFGMPPFNEQRVGKRDGRIEPFLDRAVLRKVLRRKKPARIFWCDMTDLFGAWVPDDWIAACHAGNATARPPRAHEAARTNAERHGTPAIR